MTDHAELIARLRSIAEHERIKGWADPETYIEAADALEAAQHFIKRMEEARANLPDWERLWEEQSNRADTAEAALEVLHKALATAERDRDFWRHNSDTWQQTGGPRAEAAEALLREAAGAMQGILDWLDPYPNMVPSVKRARSLLARIKETLGA